MIRRQADLVVLNVLRTTAHAGAVYRKTRRAQQFRQAATLHGLALALYVARNAFSDQPLAILAPVPVQGESSDSPLFTPHQVAAIAFLFSAVLTILAVLCVVLWVRS